MENSPLLFFFFQEDACLLLAESCQTGGARENVKDIWKQFHCFKKENQLKHVLVHTPSIDPNDRKFNLKSELLERCGLVHRGLQLFPPRSHYLNYSWNLQRFRLLIQQRHECCLLLLMAPLRMHVIWMLQIAVPCAVCNEPGSKKVEKSDVGRPQC